jgi:hypothetical protein
MMVSLLLCGAALGYPASSQKRTDKSAAADEERAQINRRKREPEPQFAFFNEFEGQKPPDDSENGGHDVARTNPEFI